VSELLPQLTDAVGRRFGLAARPAWRRDMENGIRALCQRHGCEASEIERLLEEKPDLMIELVGFLTVGETYFLRHPAQLEFAIAHLRERLKRETKKEKLVAWSAGCSSGEEPYSLAILAHRELGLPTSKRLTITATDLSEAALERARRAHYGAWSFRDAPPWLLAQYFEVVDGGCQLTSPIRDQVAFHHVPIAGHLENLGPASVDLILFRNVAIYLTKAALAEVYSAFHRVLDPTGILIVAPADPRPPASLFARIEESPHGAYRAVHGAPAAVAAAPRPAVAAPRPSPPPARIEVRRPVVPAPLPPAPSRPAVAPLPPSNQLGHDDGLRLAKDLGNRGETERALEMANQLVRSSPSSRDALLLRGKIYLANDRASDAVEDLRKVVFLRPDDSVARFWYATALFDIRNVNAALKQLREIESRLSSLAPETPVDEDVSVDELLTTVRLLKEGIE